MSRPIGTPALRATFASSLQCKRGQELGCIVGPASVPCLRAVKALGENPPRARCCVAESATAMYTHPHDLMAPGQIKRMTVVPAMLPSTQLTTSRTRHGDSIGLDGEDETAFALHHD